MPSLLDARIEKFCQEIARDASLEEAMHNAGYAQTNAYRNATAMLQRPYVKERIKELCRELGKEHPNTPPRVKAPPRPAGRPRKYNLGDPEEIDLTKITYDWVMREAVSAYLLAKAQRNAALMVKMLDMIGRLTGIDKRPNGRPPQKKDPNKGDVSNDKPKPDDPIDFAALVAGYGGSTGGAGAEPADEDTVDDEAEDYTA